MFDFFRKSRRIWPPVPELSEREEIASPEDIDAFEDDSHDIWAAGRRLKQNIKGLFNVEADNDGNA